MTKEYKYDEIRESFYDWLEDQSDNWIQENLDDLHHHCFNTDYYIIGTYQATQWLGTEAFYIINKIKEYEQDNFGQVTTDLSNPEKVVNMYVYIIGEDIVGEYTNNLKRVAS